MHPTLVMYPAPCILNALKQTAESKTLLRLVSDTFPSAYQEITNEASLFSRLAKKSFHLLLLDSELLKEGSLRDTIGDIISHHPELVIILCIPRSKQDHIRTALEMNVFLYLTTPLNISECNFALNRAKTVLFYRFNSIRPNTAQPTPLIPGFIGGAPKMKHLFQLIERVAEDDFSTVLIRGESGTGKELVAKAIHSKSKRAAKNFVPVNCAAIPDDLLESELFGHIKGSFTGAAQTKAGRIQYADQGTLFLDEIGDMKPNLQAKLLRVLQEKEFEPVGSLKPTPVDTRIVAATHCDLEELVKTGSFREDLYYRLSVVPIEVPPLRERIEDIPLLLERFINTYTTKRKRKRISFSSDAVAVLENHNWRGNVRELENLVQHMSILYSGRTVRPQDLPEKFTTSLNGAAVTRSTPPPPHPIASDSPHDISRERADLYGPINTSDPGFDLEEGPINLNEIMSEFESDLILKAMRFTSGNKKEAARILCLKRTTLLEKIKKKGLEGLWDA